MPTPKRFKPLTKEQLAEYKRRVYDFGNVEKMMRSKVGALDRYGKQSPPR